MLSLPNQWDLASLLSMGVGFPDHMCTATHLTLWERHLLWPFQAAFGASVLLCLVPLLSLNPSHPLRPAARLGNCMKSAQSCHKCSITVPAAHSDT